MDEILPPVPRTKLPPPPQQFELELDGSRAFDVHLELCVNVLESECSPF